MKVFALVMALLGSITLNAQQTENIIIITTDGFRWQEVFTGMSPALASDSRYNQGDSALLFNKYWSKDAVERRKKLLPFFWETLAVKGQLYGNRDLGCLLNVSNPYWFSYPGYSEIMTGYVDTLINSNDYPPNPHITLPEFLQQQPSLKNKVAAFGAWDAFDRILNEQRSGIPVVAGYDTCGGQHPNSNEKLINQMLLNSHRMWGEECFDVFTHYAAMEHLKTQKPRVLYIAYGETDEWAHGWKYRSYLDAAHQVDQWISDIWHFVQSDPQYQNKTTLLITTDHGRGDTEASKWTSHGADIEGANQIWMGIIGPGIRPLGEVKQAGPYYQKQFAQTLATLMGYHFKATHPVADPIPMVLQK